MDWSNSIALITYLGLDFLLAAWKPISLHYSSLKPHHTQLFLINCLTVFATHSKECPWFWTSRAFWFLFLVSFLLLCLLSYATFNNTDEQPWNAIQEAFFWSHYLARQNHGLNRKSHCVQLHQMLPAEHTQQTSLGLSLLPSQSLTSCLSCLKI